MFVDEEALPPELSLHVLDYERASEVVADRDAHRRRPLLLPAQDAARSAGLRRAARDLPDVQRPRASLVRHGARAAVDAAECLDLLQAARDRGLVQFGENVREQVSFICNCCGCCCEALDRGAALRLPPPGAHHATTCRRSTRTQCNGCGKCVDACPVEAMTLVSANDPRKPRRKLARLDEDLCLGLRGVREALRHAAALHLRAAGRPRHHRRHLRAQGRAHGDRARQAPDLIFDNRALLSHRAMAAILGVILRLPPVKRAMASQQLRSRYLEALCAKAVQG